MGWHYTIADYVRLEEQSSIKHEYIHGEIRVMGGAIEADGNVVMAGSTIAHGRISMKVGRLLAKLCGAVSISATSSRGVLARSIPRTHAFVSSPPT